MYYLLKRTFDVLSSGIAILILSPLLIPLLFNQAMSIYKNGSYDLVTNVFPRTFPVGMSVELIKPVFKFFSDLLECRTLKETNVRSNYIAKCYLPAILKHLRNSQ